MAQRVVIIGGGITGVLTARSLCQAGWDVTVLEGAHLGAGSSSRTAAGIRQQFSTPATVRGMRHSVASYVALADELGASTITQRGYLFLVDADGEAEARARVAMQREAGLEVAWLDPGGIAARFGAEVGDEVVGGTFCATDGFLHPEVIVQEGARRVRELGGTLRTRCPVTAGVHEDGRLVAVQAGGDRIAGDLFIDATNAWTDQLATQLGATILPVSPVKRHLWVLRRAATMGDALWEGLPMIVTPPGVYARPESAGQLLMGWARGGEPEPDFEREDQDRPAPDHTPAAGLDAVPFEAWMRLAEAVPVMGDLDGVVATTSGFYGVTPDHNPFLAYDPKVPNLLRLVGFSGHGAMFGPFTAAAATALAAAGRDVDHVSLPTGDVPLAPFRIGRSFDASEAMVI